MAVLDTGPTADPCVLAGSRAVTGFWNDMGFREPPHIPPKRDSTLVMSATGRYAMQQIFQRGSPGIGACPLSLRWTRTFQRKGAMEALGGEPDFLRGSLNLRRQGAQIPLRVNRVGRNILSAVDLRADPSRGASKCPEASASFSHLVQKIPNMSDGGLHLPYTPDGLYRSETTLTFAA